MNSDKRVFIFNGYDLYGGSYMLYQLGQICYEHFGTQVFSVKNIHRGIKRFHYKYNFPTISIYNMRRIIKEQDLFICNPVQSPHAFGSKLVSKKLMYLQGATNYSHLDKNFDHYVSVSHFVQEHVKSKYGIDSPIINPYVNLTTFRHDIPWEQRNDEILVLNYKKDPQTLLNCLKENYKNKYLIEPPQFKIINSHLSQEELANIFEKHKFYLTLSPVEGFGLPSLEAMASGCVVLGLDGYGGRDYFKPNHNALVVEEKKFNRLTDYLHEIINDPNKGANLSKNAISTAQSFSFSHFEKNWKNFFEKCIFTE